MAAQGLYAPGDLMWQVNRESVLLLAGPRALLMQLAHPLVAAGVAEHSDFPADPIGRLHRTLDAMLGIIFGDEPEAHACAARVNGVHEKVHGHLQQATAHFAAGTPYDALDPDLLFWVQATLQDSALAAFECFVRPLDASERERQYQESKRMAPLLRLPPERLPASANDFRAELDATLEGPVLEITEEARALADAVLHPPLRWLPRLVGDAGSILTLGLLPPVLRERYGFSWGPSRERLWRSARAMLRAGRPWLPPALQRMSHARRAERRFAL